MQVLSKIERAGLAITEIGMDIRLMAADGVIDGDELRKLVEDAHALMEQANAVEDVALDIQEGIQIFRLGRENAPDRRLQRRRADLEAMKVALPVYEADKAA